MKYHVLYTSNYAINILSDHISSGVIHSVYRKTINFWINGKLLAIQAKDSPLSPISLVTDMSQTAMEELPVHAEQTLVWNGNSLLVYPTTMKHFTYGPQKTITPTCQISLQKAESLDLRLTSDLSKEQTTNLTNRINTAIHASDKNGFRLLFSDNIEQAHLMASAKDPILIVAGQRLQRTTELLQSGNSHDAAKELVKLIGLGIGLTPSGDDFLTGVMAGLILCHKQDSSFAIHLHHLIKNHLSDTNVISAAFLSCALEGQFSSTVNSLAHMPDSNSIIESFLQIGHSSGTDSLCGIYYILALQDYLHC